MRIDEFDESDESVMIGPFSMMDELNNNLDNSFN